jgi:hypothetical protein
MTAEAKPIKITPDIRVAELLEQADAAPVVLEQNGVRYRLSREEEDLWADYDPEKVQAMLVPSEPGPTWTPMRSYKTSTDGAGKDRVLRSGRE